MTCRLPGDVAGGALEPGDFVSAADRVAHPAHQAHVVLTQPVAEGGLRGAHIDAVTRQQVADPGGVSTGLSAFSSGISRRITL
jgi:hypothetical protein